MTIVLSHEQALALRIQAQRLDPQRREALSDAAQIVRALAGIQAQDLPSAKLALRVRSSGLLVTDVERALLQERSIVRTWGQRGTLHLLATEDLGWLLPLFAAVFIAGDSRRSAELGLDEEMYAKGIRAMREVLGEQGPLIRPMLAEQLANRGIRTEGQAIAHLVARAALEGAICFGPDHGSKPTYVLLSDWTKTGPPLSEGAAYQELTRRYLKAYGPATPTDMATWSGLPMNRIRAAWQQLTGELVAVEIAGTTAWMHKDSTGWIDDLAPQAQIVHLLPSFDSYQLGYRNREQIVSSLYAKRVNAGGGIIHPTILVNGRFVGIWKIKRQKRQLDISIEPFEQLAPEIERSLEADVADLARFLNTPAVLHLG